MLCLNKCSSLHKLTVVIVLKLCMIQRAIGLAAQKTKCPYLLDLRLYYWDITIFFQKYELTEDDHKTCISSSSFQLTSYSVLPPLDKIISIEQRFFKYQNTPKLKKCTMCRWLCRHMHWKFPLMWMNGLACIDPKVRTPLVARRGGKFFFTVGRWLAHWL